MPPKKCSVCCKVDRGDGETLVCSHTMCRKCVAKLINPVKSSASLWGSLVCPHPSCRRVSVCTFHFCLKEFDLSEQKAKELKQVLFSFPATVTVRQFSRAVDVLFGTQQKKCEFSCQILVVSREQPCDKTRDYRVLVEHDSFLDNVDRPLAAILPFTVISETTVVPKSSPPLTLLVKVPKTSLLQREMFLLHLHVVKEAQPVGQIYMFPYRTVSDLYQMPQIERREKKVAIVYNGEVLDPASKLSLRVTFGTFDYTNRERKVWVVSVSSALLKFMLFQQRVSTNLSETSRRATCIGNESVQC